MDEPEFLVCLTCDTPTYSFEFENERVTQVSCITCGNEDPKDFATDREYEGEE